MGSGAFMIGLVLAAGPVAVGEPGEQKVFDAALSLLESASADGGPGRAARFDQAIEDLTAVLGRLAQGGPGRTPAALALERRAVRALDDAFGLRDVRAEPPRDPNRRTFNLAEADTVPEGPCPQPRDVDAFASRHEGAPQLRIVMASLANRAFENRCFAQSVVLFHRVLERWPLDEDNPRIDRRMLIALDKDREFAKEAAERERIVRVYAPGSPWRAHNPTNLLADGLIETSLRQLAILHDNAAQAYESSGARKKKTAQGSAPDRSAQEYALAAAAYARYMKERSSEEDFSLAAERARAGRFADAAALYERVGGTWGAPHREQAVLLSIESWEHLISVDLKAGALSLPPIPTGAAPDGPVPPLDLPVEVERLQFAYDSAWSSDGCETSYKAAEIDLRYWRFWRALNGFQGVLDTASCTPERQAAARRAVAVIDAMWSPTLSKKRK